MTNLEVGSGLGIFYCFASLDVLDFKSSLVADVGSEGSPTGTSTSSSKSTSVGSFSAVLTRSFSVAYLTSFANSSVSAETFPVIDTLVLSLFSLR